MATELFPVSLPLQPQVQPQQVLEEPQNMSLNAPNSTGTSLSLSSSSQFSFLRSFPGHDLLCLWRTVPEAGSSLPGFQDKFREVAVKVHIRRPDRDTWAYIGRATVTHETFGQGSRIGMLAACRPCVRLDLGTDRSGQCSGSRPHHPKGHHVVQ